MVVIDNPASAWKLLNGVFCIYKPPDVGFRQARHLIAMNLTKNLNDMQPNTGPGLVKIEPPSDDSSEYRIATVPDNRRNPLLSGPSFEKEDFFIQVAPAGFVGLSGVTPAAIGSGCRALTRITQRNPVCVYHMQGKFGLRTDDYLETGHVIEKTTFGHVTRGRLERFLSFYQGSFQTRIQEAYGVDPRSQAAYELRARGLVRPRDNSHQLIYQIKLIELKLPYFTYEVHCINETDKFLLKMMNDVAEDFKTSAVCTRLRRVRWGNFTLEHALLRKHWNVENIIRSISECAVATKREMAMEYEAFLKKVTPEEEGEREEIFSPLRLIKE